MLKKLGFKKLLVILISSIVVVGAAVTSVVLITRNNASHQDNDNTNRDNIDPLAPISNGVELILEEDKVTEYYLGEEFIAPVVFAKFKNNEIIDVSLSNKLTISGYDMKKVGSQIVNVKYEDGEIYGLISYKIYVKNSYAVSISASYKDSDILWGKKLEKDKITVVLTFSNSDTKQIYDYTLKYNSEPDNYGPNEAKVSYGELSTTFTVNVVSKPVDSEFKYLEDEMKNLLTILGFVNPTCPKDYSFSKDTSGNAIFKNVGTLTSFEDKTEEEVENYLKNTLFSGYSFIEGPVATYEQIFLSNRYTFRKELENITVKIYILKYQNTFKYNLTLF